jgi:hypothetical protein
MKLTHAHNANARSVFGQPSAVSGDPSTACPGTTVWMPRADLSSLVPASLGKAILGNCTTRIVLKGDATSGSLDQG